MATGKRAENRAAMTARIRELGREHLSTHGAAGLSLRAIARDMGVVSSAVYRYVPSRDDLLTLLLVEAYNDLGDAVDRAMAASTPPRQQVHDAALAMRQWAVDDPARWALLYGSPVPGYDAPAEQTVGPGTRVVGALLRRLDAAHRAGALRELPDPGAPLDGDLSAVATEFGLTLPPGAVHGATMLWSTIVGAVSLEVFGQLGPDSFPHREEFFDGQVELALDALFSA
ncbi:MAG: TetR/AcrR family transcriptional regulator [Gordonia sp. (in: high G+C Gram-positive bacteria)]|uniref:TetR/AcrR family transcriptional regulator n=1 Tax=Gordonia sp. (in: high G+C Gram-positive bacteria) TaxID=84139 RepID=UPI0039E69CE6